MSILYQINKYNKCLVCDNDLDHRMNFLSESNNIFSFSLTNKSYPLLFTRVACFNPPLEVCIDQNDYMRIQESKELFRSMMIKASCRCGSYDIKFCNYIATRPHTTVFNFQPNLEYVSEYANVGDIRIENVNDKTSVYMFQKPNDKIHLFSINAMPMSEWNLKDPKDLRDRINKLQILI